MMDSLRALFLDRNRTAKRRRAGKRGTRLNRERKSHRRLRSEELEARSLLSALPIATAIQPGNLPSRDAETQIASASPKATIVKNLAPVVNAGSDRSCALASSVSLNGTVTDDRLPASGILTTAWSKVSGPGKVTFANRNAVDTSASFGKPGKYVLRLVASDGARRAVDRAIITVTKPATATNRPSVQTPVAQSKGVWISRDELMRLPTSGPAWDSLVKAANSPTGKPNIKDQTDNTDVLTMAKALVGVRTGNQTLINQARANVMAAIGTEAGGETLALGRNLAGYVISADIIGLSGAQDAQFRAWLRKTLTETLAAGRTLQTTHEQRPNNWGTMAGASRAAVAAYLGDKAELARTAQVFKGWLGDRGAYAGFKYGDLDWQSNPASPVGINPKGATKNGQPVDGALPEELRRGGGFQTSPTYTDYCWEALQGAFTQAEILYRAGYNTYQWQDKALLRAVNYLNSLGKKYDNDWYAHGDDQWQPSLINARYGASFPAVAGARPGKIMGWTDWTMQNAKAAAPQAAAKPSSAASLRAQAADQVLASAF